MSPARPMQAHFFRSRLSRVMTYGQWASKMLPLQRVDATFTLHWDGTAWSEIPSPNVDESSGLSGVDGAAPNDVWAVGIVSNAGALAMHWDGAVWTVVPTPDDGDSPLVSAISSTNVLAVGEHRAPPSPRAGTGRSGVWFRHRRCLKMQGCSWEYRAATDQRGRSASKAFLAAIRQGMI